MQSHLLHFADAVANPVTVPNEYISAGRFLFVNSIQSSLLSCSVVLLLQHLSWELGALVGLLLWSVVQNRKDSGIKLWLAMF